MVACESPLANQRPLTLDFTNAFDFTVTTFSSAAFLLLNARRLAIFSSPGGTTSIHQRAAAEERINRQTSPQGLGPQIRLGIIIEH